MLDTARLEDQQLELEMGDHDLRELVGAAIVSMRPLLGAEHHLEMKVPAEPVRVRGDRIRTSAIVANLIDNAIKYSPAGGPVQVEILAAASEPASVRVKDEGLGIDADDQARLFSLFGRIVTSDNSHIPGSGLGLYLAQRLARVQGGDLVLEESKPGLGSSFRLDLVYVGTSSPGRES